MIGRPRAGLKYFKYFKIETFHLKYLILKHLNISNISENI